MDLDNIKIILNQITDPTIWHTVTLVGTLHLFGIRIICQTSTNLGQFGTLQEKAKCKPMTVYTPDPFKSSKAIYSA